MKLLEDIDDLLAYLEDTAHGEEGKRITEMRNRIQTEQSNSHKPVVVRGGDELRESVKRVQEYLDWIKGDDTPNTPTEPLPAAGSAKSVCRDKTRKKDGPCKYPKNSCEDCTNWLP
jgi:hypothetical protein